MFLIGVTRVQPLPNRNLDLTFEDGFHGIVEIDRIVKNYTGVFAPLLQDEFFRQVMVNTELGTVVWPRCRPVPRRFVFTSNGHTCYHFQEFVKEISL